MDTIGYFPGCSLQGSAFDYDRSVRALAQQLSIVLREIPDWVCCGASSAHAVDREVALCLAADTLAKARRAGLDEVLVPCAMCFQRLAAASQELTEHRSLAGEIAGALGGPADLDLTRVKAVNPVEWLVRLLPGTLGTRARRPLTGLRVACYYGCLLVRPPKVTRVEEPEAPRQMEGILKALGATTVRWGRATECCGASFSLSRKSVVLRQGLRIWELAVEAGANVLCVACPMCHANLDMRQSEFLSEGQEALPVLYLTQLAGLAAGLGPEQLGLGDHFVSVDRLLSTLGPVGRPVTDT
ncbi:MAG: CoB--CoM heterodisulfide reductase iron-sulfur subunit B family protein [Candidatus Riflebacteria bacterium]|nr:CoB--CoM heterodisulfide reductase iron-sulfur subunit B family protein [Candidatus Riflebacteria bacterium]